MCECVNVYTWREFVKVCELKGSAMGEAVAAVARMAGLEVRGAMCRGGYVVFSVVDFIVKARRDTPTYGAATCWFRGLRGRKGYEEQLRHDVVYVELARGEKSYPTACKNLLWLHRLLTYLQDEAEPEFRRAFLEVVGEFM
jgi:hypothetical protein